MRTAVVLCLFAAAGCDGVFGIDPVHPPGDGAPPGGLAYVQDVSAKEPLGELVANFQLSQPPAAHDLLVVVVAAYHNTPSNVFDTANNSYSMLSVEGTTAGGSSLYMFYAADVATAAQFTLTVTSIEGAQVGEDELSIDAIEYRGAQTTSPHDVSMASAGSGAGGQVDEDCKPLQVTAPEIMVAGLVRDFNGSTVPAAGWLGRGSVDLDHTQYAVLDVADRIAGPEVAHPEFSSVHEADGYTWACLWATFR